MLRLKQGLGFQDGYAMASQVNKGHGRLEKRTIITTSLLNEYLDCPHVVQMVCLERLVYHDPEKQRLTLHVVFGLSRLSQKKAGANQMLSLVRQYWRIENALHFRHDVTFLEDRTLLTLKNAEHNMAILNNLIIGLFSMAGFSNHAIAQRLFSANPVSALRLLFGEY